MHFIIGSKKTWGKTTNFSEEIAFRLYTRALDLRRRYLYGHSGIRVVIWDTILDNLKDAKPVSEIVDKLKPDSSISVTTVTGKVSLVIEIGGKVGCGSTVA